MHHGTGAGPFRSPLSGVALPRVRLNVAGLWGCRERALGVSPGEESAQRRCRQENNNPPYLPVCICS